MKGCHEAAESKKGCRRSNITRHKILLFTSLDCQCEPIVLKIYCHYTMIRLKVQLLEIQRCWIHLFQVKINCARRELGRDTARELLGLLTLIQILMLPRGQWTVLNFSPQMVVVQFSVKVFPSCTANTSGVKKVCANAQIPFPQTRDPEGNKLLKNILN